LISTQWDGFDKKITELLVTELLVTELLVTELLVTELLVTEFPLNQHVFLWLVCVMCIVISTDVWYIAIKLSLEKDLRMVICCRWQTRECSVTYILRVWIKRSRICEYLLNMSLTPCDILNILHHAFPHAVFTVHEGIVPYYSLTIISLLYLRWDEINYLYHTSSALQHYRPGFFSILLTVILV
jgi:hypothetical protein